MTHVLCCDPVICPWSLAHGPMGPGPWAGPMGPHPSSQARELKNSNAPKSQFPVVFSNLVVLVGSLSLRPPCGHLVSLGIPDASQMLPDASQMPPRCSLDASQMAPRCFSLSIQEVFLLINKNCFFGYTTNPYFLESL